MNTICHVCIAPKNSRRLASWEALLSSKGLPLITFSYWDIIHDKFFFETGVDYLIRLESPGEDEQTYQAVVELTGPNRQQKTLAHGEVEEFKRWNKGWNILLAKIKILQKLYAITFVNDPEAISIAFDKVKTQQILEDNKISVPRNLGLCKDYNHLMTTMKAHSLTQVFLKPTSGSSASGVMAFRSSTNKRLLSTTLRKKDGILFNSLRLMKYSKEEEIRELIDTLSHEDLMMEQWIPKWKEQGLFIDFRVLVINGKAQFIVPRGSKHTITNLHLGNVKLKFEDLGLTDRQKIEIIDVAEEAMTHFPTLFYAGLDLLMDKNGEVHVLEINAFGDLLLGITNDKGQSVYEAEFEEIIKSR